MKSIRNKIDSILDYDFQHVIEIDHNGETNCESSGCEEMGICRCYTITDIKISEIDSMELSKVIYNHLFQDLSKEDKRNIEIDKIVSNEFDMNLYYINRLVRIYKLYDSNYWNVDYGGGYYGDEVYDIKMDVTKKFISDLHFILLDNKSKIDHLLFLEYGYVDDRLVGKKYELNIVEKSDLYFPQKEHYNNVYEGLQYYSDTDYNLPRGIVLKVDNKYRVFDGYHRLKNTKLDVCEVIVLS